MKFRGIFERSEPSGFDLPQTNLRVLDSIHEDGAKLVEMSPETASELRASQPGLRIVPIVYNYPAVVRPLTIAATVKATIAGTSLGVQVLDADGTAVSSATVVAFTDFANKAGAQGTTNAKGQVSLALGGKSKKSNGTHVAGIIAGRGAAPAVRLFSFRVFGKGQPGASNYAIAKGIDAAVQNQCDLINMSLGGGDAEEATKAAIADARNAGSVVIVAAGNDGRQPVNFKTVHSGDMRRDRVLATFSFSAASSSRSFSVEAVGLADSMDRLVTLAPVPAAWVCRGKARQCAVADGPSYEFSGPGKNRVDHAGRNESRG